MKITYSCVTLNEPEGFPPDVFTVTGIICVFDVINRCLLQRKPMIITTNISKAAMEKAPDLEERRIYDRILDVCAPICFNGENFRKAEAAQTTENAAQLIGVTQN